MASLIALIISIVLMAAFPFWVTWDAKQEEKSENKISEEWLAVEKTNPRFLVRVKLRSRYEDYLTLPFEPSIEKRKYNSHHCSSRKAQVWCETAFVNGYFYDDISMTYIPICEVLNMKVEKV